MEQPELRGEEGPETTTSRPPGHVHVQTPSEPSHGASSSMTVATAAAAASWVRSAGAAAPQLQWKET